MSDTPIEIAKIFFAHLSADRMEEALAMLSDDVLYDNVPFPTIIGRDGVRKFHVDFGFGNDFRAESKVVNIAASGNVVLSERTDIFFHSSGGTITLPVMGIITVEDGIITVWRDYFDPTDFGGIGGNRGQPDPRDFPPLSTRKSRSSGLSLFYPVLPL